MNRNFDPEAEAIARIERWNEEKEWSGVKYFDDLSPETETYLNAFCADFAKEKAILEEKENKKESVRTKAEIIGATKEESLGLSELKETQNISVEERLQKEQQKQLNNAKATNWLHSLHQIHPTLKKEDNQKIQTKKLAVDRGR